MPGIIDGHTHIGLKDFLTASIPAEKLKRPAFRDPMENTIENLIARMDANKVAMAVTFPYPLAEVDRLRANDYVLAAHAAYPDRIIPFALIGDDVETWLALGVRGFKQQDILYAPERFNLRRAYRLIAAAGVPVLIHFRAGEGYSVPQQAKAILRGAPGLKLIVAHMGRHTPNTAEKVEAALLGLRDEPSVLFETSTVRDPAIIARAVEIVGEDRVIFGSDYPFNSSIDADPLAEELRVIGQAGLPTAVREKVLGGNIRALLGMEERLSS